MFKFFTSDLRRNLTKILCLTVGLAVGFLLVAKIYFEQTFDSHFSDIDRMYIISESTVEQGEYKEYDYTPGGTAPELLRAIPQIEAVTRYTTITGGQSAIRLEDGRIIDVDNIALADSCLFDVLPASAIEGNLSLALATKDNVVIPRSIAEKIGGNVLGESISFRDWPEDIKLTIAGVYEDHPLNSTIPNAVYISMPTISKFTWDGTENLLGNDRYRSYARLAKGIDPDDLHGPILEHLKTKVPEEAFRIGDYRVWLRPLKGRYADQDGVKTMSWMLGMLAVVMLMCAGLNYLLIVIGQLSARGKEMAIRKCYGTGRGALFLRVMGESVFFLAISLGLAILLAFCMSNLCKELLGYTPQQLLSTRHIWVTEGIVCLVLLIITGVIPSIIYSRTPVAQAFRPSTRGRKGWKLALLAIQFFATGLIMCLLVLVGRQYYMLGKAPMGFQYENIGIFWRSNLPEDRASAIVSELKKLPFVEGVASKTAQDISEIAGGNMFWTEGQYDNQINVADMYYMNPELIDVLGLKLVQGRNFNLRADTTINEAIVEERMIEVLMKVFGETDEDIVGKTFYLTEHGTEPHTIVGVIGNIRRGGFEYDRADTRPGILFPTRNMGGGFYVRFTELTPENLKEAQKVIDSIRGTSEVYIYPYKNTIDAKLNPIRRFGKSVMVVGFAIVIIALIGLIGYVADEVNRRSKEIAIRKVNGTSASKIVRLFCIDILKVALPSLIAGGAVAMIIGQKWLSQFMERVSLSPLSMALCLTLLLLLIVGIVTLNSLRVSRSNPVEHLRSE